MEYLLGYYFIAIGPNLWGAPHMSSFGFMALCFPVSAKGCVCPLDGQPGASKPLSVQATATILSKLHHLSRSHQCNRSSAAAGFASRYVDFFFSLPISFFPPRFLMFNVWNCILLSTYNPCVPQSSLEWNLKTWYFSCFIVFPNIRFLQFNLYPTSSSPFTSLLPFIPWPTWKEVTAGQWYVCRVNSGYNGGLDQAYQVASVWLTLHSLFV